MRRRPAFFRFFQFGHDFCFETKKIFRKKLFSHDIKPFLTNLGIKVIRNYLIFSISTFIHHKNSDLVNKVPKSAKNHLLGLQCVDVKQCNFSVRKTHRCVFFLVSFELFIFI